MDKKTLSAQGFDLANELARLGETYHAKSDASDILGYEAATIREKAKDLVENCGVSLHLRKSTLLSSWGESVLHQLPDSEIIVRVEEFHRNYQKLKRG